MRVHALPGNALDVVLKHVEKLVRALSRFLRVVWVATRQVVHLESIFKHGPDDGRTERRATSAVLHENLKQVALLHDALKRRL